MYRISGLQMHGKYMSKLAVIFPGIGYHKDKPLLYYGVRIARNRGHEIKYIEYHDMPGKLQGDAKMMREAVEIGYRQAEEILAGVEFDAYEEILLIGKSIGTVIASRFAKEHKLHCRQIWYTPVEATFMFDSGDTNELTGKNEITERKDVISFIGDNDPWSKLEDVKKLVAEHKIPLHLYEDCNHSLECGEIVRDIATLKDVMEKTEHFLED